MDLVLCDDESRLVLTNRIIRKRFVFPGHSTVRTVLPVARIIIDQPPRSR